MNIAIDLGTHSVRVAHLQADGGPRFLSDPNHQGAIETPSLVYFGRDSVLVGFRARELAVYNPSLPVIRQVKQHLGTSQRYTDASGHAWSPTEAAAMLFRKVDEEVRGQLHERVERAVLTVPHSFDAARRQAYVTAASLGGFRKVDLLDEPLAIAWRGLPRIARCMVINMGAAGLDISIVEPIGRDLCCAHHLMTPQVGGDAFDELIVNEIARCFAAQHQVNILQNPVEKPRWRRLAEETKRRLSEAPASCVRDVLLSGSHAVEFEMSAWRFEALLRPALARTADLGQLLLTKAKLGWNDLDFVILAGGSVLMPLFRETFLAATKLPADKLIDRHPKEACCFGAALFAGQQSADGRRARSNLNYQVQISAKSGGGSMNESCFARQTPLPVTRTVIVRCNQLRQPSIDFTLQQQSSTGDRVGEPLAFRFGGVNNTQNPHYPIEVTIEADTNGVFSARARDSVTGKTLQGGAAIPVTNAALLTGLTLMK